MASKNDYFIPILITCIISTSLFFAAYADESGTPYSYVIGAPNGPQNWSNLNTSWTICRTGIRQSPIDIVRPTVWPRLGDLIKQYRGAPARLIKGSHDIKVKWTGDAGGITINGIAFKLDEFHWHIPSEHTVNGIRYNMELHMVHVNAQGNIAVVGILYTLGQDDPFLTQIEPFLPSVTSSGINIGVIDPSTVGFTGRPYYRYNGSLTTPPCSENVIWTVYKLVKTVSQRQINALRNAVNDGTAGNARPIQPLNGRLVYLFEPQTYG